MKRLTISLSEYQVEKLHREVTAEKKRGLATSVSYKISQLLAKAWGDEK